MLLEGLDMSLGRNNDFFEQFRETWFPEVEDDTWKNWVSLEPRNFRSLCELVADSTVRETFKARALIIALAQNDVNCPIYWKRDGSTLDGMSEVSAMNLDGLSRDLLNFVAELLVYTGEQFQVENKAAPKCYHSYTLQLLGRLTITECEKLWSCYVNIGPKPFSSMDDSSGYGSWRSMMSDKNVPMHWKVLADSKFREIIEWELQGKIIPKREMESPFSCYQNQVFYLVYGTRNDKQLPYDVSLLASQISYILSKERFREKDVDPIYDLKIVLWYLSGDEYREIRQQLVRKKLGNEKNPFEIHNTNDMTLAELMLSELSANDPDAVRIQNLIESSKEEVARYELSIIDYHAFKSGVLDKMKV